MGCIYPASGVEDGPHLLHNGPHLANRLPVGLLVVEEVVLDHEAFELLLGVVGPASFALSDLVSKGVV